MYGRALLGKSWGHAKGGCFIWYLSFFKQHFQAGQELHQRTGDGEAENPIDDSQQLKRMKHANNNELKIN